MIKQSLSAQYLKISEQNYFSCSMNLRRQWKVDWLHIRNRVHRDDIHIIVYLATNPKMTDIKELNLERNLVWHPTRLRNPIRSISMDITFNTWELFLILKALKCCLVMLLGAIQKCQCFPLMRSCLITFWPLPPTTLYDKNVDLKRWLSL